MHHHEYKDKVFVLNLRNQSRSDSANRLTYLRLLYDGLLLQLANEVRMDK